MSISIFKAQSDLQVRHTLAPIPASFPSKTRQDSRACVVSEFVLDQEGWFPPVHSESSAWYLAVPLEFFVHPARGSSVERKQPRSPEHSSQFPSHWQRPLQGSAPSLYSGWVAAPVLLVSYFLRKIHLDHSCGSVFKLQCTVQTERIFLHC